LGNGLSESAKEFFGIARFSRRLPVAQQLFDPPDVATLNGAFYLVLEQGPVSVGQL